MMRTLLTAAAALAVATGAALAADPAAPSYEQQGTGSIASGYLFPNDGSPSGDEPNARVAPQQSTSGGLGISHVYLYPPSEGSDSGSD